MLEHLKNLVRGTRIEPASRVLFRRLSMRPLSKAQIENIEYDRLTYEIIRRVVARHGNCVDVGCHAGKVLDAIVAAAPDGKHHAFEPLPAFAARLRNRFPAVEIHEMALADRTGTSMFQHVVERPAYSGLARRPYDGDVTVEEIAVRVARLDDVLDPLYRIDFLKLDVEGGELGVLRGARNHIVASAPTIVFEFGAGAASAYGDTGAGVYGFLGSCGLRISHLRSFLAGRPPLGLEDFVTSGDFVFVAHP